MMIGVLDPALLLPRPGEEDRLEAELDDILRICRKGNVVLPTFEEYWPALWKDLGTALQRTLSNPRTRRALDELRRLGRAPAGIPPFLVPQGRNRVYGLLPMFDIPGLGAAWLAKMTTTLARASSSSIPSILLTRRMDGRNIEAHQVEDSRIEEVTRWVLYLHLSGSPARAVYCIHHPRNLSRELRWTTRYDWRLPATSDGAKHPFCPPEQWWKRKVDAVRTIKSKPAFIDAKGNGWARPNINEGKGYHWDVYLTDPNLSERIGLSQLNIVGYGGPPGEKSPGEIHHTGQKKKGRLLDDSGWTC